MLSFDQFCVIVLLFNILIYKIIHFLLLSFVDLIGVVAWLFILSFRA